MQILLPTLKKELDSLRKKLSTNENDNVLALDMIGKLSKDSSDVINYVLNTWSTKNTTENGSETKLGDKLAEIILTSVLIGLLFDIDVYSTVINKLKNMQQKHDSATQ